MGKSRVQSINIDYRAHGLFPSLQKDQSKPRVLIHPYQFFYYLYLSEDSQLSFKNWYVQENRVSQIVDIADRHIALDVYLKENQLPFPNLPPLRLLQKTMCLSVRVDIQQRYSSTFILGDFNKM